MATALPGSSTCLLDQTRLAPPQQIVVARPVADAPANKKKKQKQQKQKTKSIQISTSTTTAITPACLAGRGADGQQAADGCGKCLLILRFFACFGPEIFPFRIFPISLLFREAFCTIETRPISFFFILFPGCFSFFLLGVPFPFQSRFLVFWICSRPWSSHLSSGQNGVSRNNKGIHDQCKSICFYSDFEA